MIQGDQDTAQKMSQVADRVVQFVLQCGDVFRNRIVHQISPSPSNNEQLPAFGRSLTPIDNSTASFATFLKRNFTYAKSILGSNSSVNTDRLFLVFGRCWDEDLKLDVTQLIIVSFYLKLPLISKHF
jgi:hypothetical protein